MQAAAMFPPGMTPEMFGFIIQAMTSMMHPMMQPQGTPLQGTPVQGLRQLPPAFAVQAAPVPVAAMPPATNEEHDEGSEEEDDAEEEEEEAPQEEEEEAED